MNHWMMTLVAGTVLVLGAGVQGAASQEPLNWMEPTEEDCQRAEYQMEERPTGRERHRAMEYLTLRCGTSGRQAVAREFLTMRTVTDTVLLNHIVRELVRFRDPVTLAAATELAGDQSATLESRIAGLRVKVTQVHPWYRVWFQDFKLPDGMIAIDHGTLGPLIGPEDPGFPTRWKETTESLLTRIMENPGESEAMRWAANRGLYYLKAFGHGSGGRL